MMEAEILEVVDDNCTQTISLSGKKMTMGIGSNADICTLAEKYSDLEHATLELKKKKWFIRDNFSVTGIYVDGTKVNSFENIPLESGCQIMLGPPTLTNVRYEFHSKPAAKKNKQKGSSSHKKRKRTAESNVDDDDYVPEAEECSDDDDEETSKLSLRARVALRLAKSAASRVTENDENKDANVTDKPTSKKKRCTTKKHSLSELCEFDEETKSLIVAIPQKRLLELEKCEKKCRLYEAQLVQQKWNMKEQLENELTCPICYEVFKKAVTVSCGHSFCQQCLVSWTKNEMTCPVCRSYVSQQYKSLVTDSVILALSKVV